MPLKFQRKRKGATQRLLRAHVSEPSQPATASRCSFLICIYAARTQRAEYGYGARLNPFPGFGMGAWQLNPYPRPLHAPH